MVTNASCGGLVGNCPQKNDLFKELRRVLLALNLSTGVKIFDTPAVSQHYDQNWFLQRRHLALRVTLSNAATLEVGSGKTCSTVSPQRTKPLCHN